MKREIVRFSERNHMRRNWLAKLLLWGLVGSLTLGLTACGEEAGKGNNTSAEMESESAHTVGSGDSLKGTDNGTGNLKGDRRSRS